MWCQVANERNRVNNEIKELRARVQHDEKIHTDQFAKLGTQQAQHVWNKNASRTLFPTR